MPSNFENSVEQSRKQMHRSHRSGDYQSAIAAADAILSNNPHDPEALMLKAMIFSVPDPRFSDPSKAFAHGIEAIKLDATNADRWAELAEVQMMLGDYGYAILSYKKALEINHNHYDALVGLASTARHSPMPFYVSDSEVETLLKKAASLKPNDWRAHYELGNLSAAQGLKQEARHHYSVARDCIGNSDPRIRESIENGLKACA